MLISNPVDNPLFWPTAYVVLGILGSTLLVLLVITRFNLARLGQSVLFRRWRVWAVIAPVYGLAILSGQLTTMLLVALLIFQGLREYAQLVRLPSYYATVLIVLGPLAAPVALLSSEAFYALPAVLLIAGTLQPLLLNQDGQGVRHLAFSAFGWGYIAWFLGHVMLLYIYIPGGPGVLLAIGLGTALSDVGAFVVGKTFGKHKMAPRLSPNKTWEGAVGNVLGAYVGVGLTFYALPDNLRLPAVLLLPIVIALGAIWGDLLESSIKREFEVKDAGVWLPGFGGLLDRIDSLIIVVPLVYYFLRWVG
jgi:phosphatidate cytidylyltransferase